MDPHPNSFDLSPPENGDDPVSVMKWMISVMDRGDKSLMFVSSCLSQCIKYGGLTEKQAASIEKAFVKIVEKFNRGGLEIQCGDLSEGSAPSNVTRLRVTQ